MKSIKVNLVCLLKTYGNDDEDISRLHSLFIFVLSIVFTIVEIFDKYTNSDCDVINNGGIIC